MLQLLVTYAQGRHRDGTTAETTQRSGHLSLPTLAAGRPMHLGGAWLEFGLGLELAGVGLTVRFGVKLDNGASALPMS